MTLILEAGVLPFVFTLGKQPYLYSRATIRGWDGRMELFLDLPLVVSSVVYWNIHQKYVCIYIYIVR